VSLIPSQNETSTTPTTLPPAPATASLPVRQASATTPTTLPPATTQAPPTTTPDNISAASAPALKLSPAEVIGAATGATSIADAATKARAIAGFKAGSKLADTLNSKGVDYQTTFWKDASNAVKGLLQSAGYKPPSQQDAAQSGGFWHTIAHGFDDVRHLGGDAEIAANDALIKAPAAAFNAAAKPLTTLVDAQQMTEMQGDMTDMKAGKSTWSLDKILHQFDVGSIIRNYNSIYSGTAHFQPEALLYVQKDLGINGSTLALLKTYVLAGGQGGPALQQALASVPASERQSAQDLIMRNPKFQEAANLLNDSHLSLGQMLFGGVTPDQLKQIYPKMDVGAAKLGAAVNQANAIVGAAGSIATGDPAGDVSLLSTGLQGVGTIRAAAATGVVAAGATGIGGSLATGKTPDQVTAMAPFGLHINPLSGVVDGTFSWYTNPLFMAQRSVTEYKAGLHGIATLDAFSQTKTLRYYLNIGAGRRFATTFAKAVTSPDGSEKVASGFAERANVQALENAGIKTVGMQDVIRENFPAILKDIQAGGDGVQPVAEMMASNQAMINIVRGNAGMFFQDATQYPHITVPQAIISDIKGAVRSSFGGKRFNTGKLSPSQLSEDIVGRQLTEQAVAADKAADPALGPLSRFARRAVTLMPKPYFDLTTKDGGVNLERILKFSLEDSKIAQIRNLYESIPMADVAHRRFIALSAIKDMLLGAGIGKTQAGQDWLEGWMNRENYGYGLNAHWSNPYDPEGPTVPVALRENQLSNAIAIPDFREVYKFAKKSYVMDKLQMGMNAEQFDSFMSKYWKRAMLLRPGFAIRVAGEEVLNFMLRHGAASYVNGRIASSLYDTVKPPKEMTSLRSAWKQLLGKKEMEAAMGDPKAANELDVGRLRDAMTGHLPDEVRSLIKTPEQLMASVQGWHGLNFLRRVGIHMTPDWLLEGAFELAKRGVLDSAYNEYIDAIMQHGALYTGDVPTGGESSMTQLENGQHLYFQRTGKLKTYAVEDSEFLPRWQMELSGHSGSMFSRAAAQGFRDSGTDGAIQYVKDTINATRINRDVVEAQAKYDKVPNTANEIALKSAKYRLAEHEEFVKNFAGHFGTKDGRMVALGQATQDQATQDWAEAVVKDVQDMAMTTEPQDFTTVDGEKVPAPTSGPQPIRIPGALAPREPWKIATRDEGRSIVEANDQSPYKNLAKNEVRLFRAENTATAQEGLPRLENPGRSWTPSYRQAEQRAGEDGRVFKIDVPIAALKEHYDYKGTGNVDDYIEHLQNAQGAGKKFAGEPEARGYFESGNVAHTPVGDAAPVTIIDKIAQHLAPSVQELQRVDRVHAPDKLVVPETVPMVMGPGDFIAKAGELGMRQLVGRPLNWMSRQPIFTYNYALALRSARMLIKARSIEDAEGDLAHDIALEKAVNETLPYIHNPKMKSYMSIVGRNIAPFWFAQEQFYKRWGRLFGTYPEAFYKLSMAVNGMKATGFLYTDTYGKLAFVYPGSPQVVAMLSKIPAFGGLSIAAGFSSELGGLNPSTASGSVLPVPSFGPLLTLPATFLGGMFPEFTSIGNTMLGSQAQPIDQTGNWPVQAIEQLAPSIGTRFLQWITEENAGAPNNVTSGLMAQASIGAAQQLEAAGHGMSVYDQAHTLQYNQYLERVSNWAKNMILLRTILGFGAPATPNFYFNDHGEGAIYQALLNTMPYQEAQAAFIKDYPNATPETIFSSTTSGPKGSGTFVPATLQAGQFINANKEFFTQYTQLAPWTMPASLQKGLFNSNTYQSEKSIDLRFARSLDSWYTEVKYAEGANIYYPQEQLFQAAESATSAVSVTAQQGLGITQLEAQQKIGLVGAPEAAIKDKWATWAKSFTNAHPIFEANYRVMGDQAMDRRNHIIQELKDAIDKGALPDSPFSKKIPIMMTSYEQVEYAYNHGLKGTHQATENWIGFLQWGNSYAREFPAVAPFWNGVLSKQKVG
jgi:hypothetical protein